MQYHYEKERDGKLFCYIDNNLDVPAHMHNSIEIIYVVRGTAKAFYDGKEYTLSENEAFIAFPQRIHNYYESHDIKAIISIIPVEFLPEFRTLFLNKNILTPHIKTVPPLAGTLLKKAAVTKTGYYKAFQRGAILSAFSMLAENAKYIEKTSSSLSVVQKLLDYCECNYKNNISLEDISKALFVSKSHISHIFSDKIGVNFRDYLNSLRLAYSLNLLKDGVHTIAEISSYCGFESIRSFNRAFKKQFNTSPTEYRRNLNELM